MNQKTQSPLFFYGWVIVAVAFTCNFIAVGTGFYIFNVFIEDLERELHCSRAELGWIFTLFMIFASSYQFIMGRLVQRFGVRPVMLMGGLILGLAYILFSLVHSYFAFLVLVGLVLSLGNAGLHGATGNTVVSRWFVRKRGTALGIANMGVSLSGVFIPFLGLYLLRQFGLHQAFLIIGILILAVVLLPVFLFIKESPESQGLMPDGAALPEPGDVENSGQAPTERLWTIREAAGTGSFWKIGAAYALALLAVAGIMFQLHPHFRNLGFSEDTAVALLGATALLGALGKVVWGSLTDRFEIRRVIALMFSGQMLGILIMLAWPTESGAYAFVIVFGFSMGGVVATFPAIIARMFGPLSFPVVWGGIAPMLMLQGLGHPIMGESFDRFGSYLPAYGLFIVNYAIAALLILLARQPGTDQAE